MWIGRPCKPEEADGQDDGANDHGRQAFFGDDMPVFGHGAREVCAGGVDDRGGAACDSDDE